MYPYSNTKRAAPWNKGKIIGQKPPLEVREIWALRVRLQLAHRTRELALFNLAIDSKLRGCDLVRLRVRDVQRGTQVARRAIVMQSKTQRPVQFELSDQTREAVSAWIAEAHLSADQFLFPSRMTPLASHLDTAVCEARGVLSGTNWVGSCRIRHALVTPYQSDPDLPPNTEPPSSATPAWPHETGEHSPVSGDRG